MGRRIREFHKQVRGVTPAGIPYHALEPDAYAWVHATLAVGIVQAHERFGVRLTAAEREQLWAEWRTLGRLLGIAPATFRPPGTSSGRTSRGPSRNPPAHTGRRGSARCADPSSPTGALPRVPAAVAVHLQTAEPCRHGGDRGAAPRRPAGAFRCSVGTRPGAQLRVLEGTLRAVTPVMPDYLLNTGPGYLEWRSEELAGARWPRRSSPERRAPSLSPRTKRREARRPSLLSSRYSFFVWW